MDGYGADRVIDLESALDPVMQLVGNPDPDTADEEGLNRVVEVVPGRGGNDAGKAA